MLIITGSDDNYVPGVMVLIASAAFHNPGARFAVLDMGISPANRDRIDALAARLQVSVRRVEVASDAFDHIAVARSHLTRSTYLRLLIPDLFPDEDRVIYMDCDMVVLDDLSALQRLDLGRNIIAAVPCPSPDPVEVAATGHCIGSYVNAGLLVMNLPVWRQEAVAGTCLKLLSDPARPLLSEDQSAINIAAAGRIHLLDPRFNTYSDPGAYKRLQDFPDVPAVVHYVVNNKPWNIAVSLGRLWRFHASRIGDLMPPLRPVTLRRRLSLLNRDRKLIVGIALRRPKYCMRRQVARHMNGVVTEAYLARAGARAVVQVVDQAGSLA
ncbi:MAG: glycosyltransferase family 8 protein [Paracoccus sp. (in: a-proteobacteria)]